MRARFDIWCASQVCCHRLRRVFARCSRTGPNMPYGRLLGFREGDPVDLGGFVAVTEEDLCRGWAAQPCRSSCDQLAGGRGGRSAASGG